MKTRTHLGRWLIAAVALVGASSAYAADPHSVTRHIPPGADQMSMIYTGSLVRVGTFKGKLVCLRCDLAHAPDGAAQCQKEGHRHALSMEGGSMIHPLLAGTDETLKQINSGELHAKNVIITGQYYLGTGAILVNSITLAP